MRGDQTSARRRDRRHGSRRCPHRPARRRRCRQRRDVADRAARRAAVPGPMAVAEPGRRAGSSLAPACPPERPAPGLACIRPAPAARRDAAVRRRRAARAGRAQPGRDLGRATGHGQAPKAGVRIARGPERLARGQGGHRPGEDGPAQPRRGQDRGRGRRHPARPRRAFRAAAGLLGRGLGRDPGRPAAGQDLRLHHPLAAHLARPGLRDLDPPGRPAGHRDPAAGAGPGGGHGAHRDDRLARRAALGPGLGLRVVRPGARPRRRHGHGRQDGQRERQQRRRLLRDERHQPARRLATRRRPVRRHGPRRAAVGVRRARRRPDPHPRLQPGRGRRHRRHARLPLPAAARHHPRVPVDHGADRGLPAAGPGRPPGVPARARARPPTSESSCARAAPAT